MYKDSRDIQEPGLTQVTKDVLVQYCEIREELKDLNSRIDKDQIRLGKIESEGSVTDSVKGTRMDGTIGSIKITGFPIPEYDTVKNMMRRRIAKLKILEDELQEALNAVDDYINRIPKSELRQIFRLYYLDDLTWPRVAMSMNNRFPKKSIKYTEDSCRMQHNRYLEK